MTNLGGVPPSGSSDTFSLGGYQNMTEIGRGASGVVFRAWQCDFDRWVAIKVLRIGADHVPLSQFTRERTAIGSLSGHPNIVTVYNAGLTSDRTGFIVMEYLPDGTLADRLRQGPLPCPEVMEIGVRLSGALESAHRVGVLHLDVKPENVFLSQAYDSVKLGDFGIARIRGRTVTRTGMITGTLLHLAPERLRDQPPTAASDVYSLASTLFTLIVGHPPFGGADEEDHVVMGRLLRDRHPVPELGSEPVPALLRQTIEQALAPDPGDRPATAAEFGERLRRAQAEAGLPATPMLIRASSGGLTSPPRPNPRARPDGEATLPPSPTPPDAAAEDPVGPPAPRRGGRVVVGAVAGAALTAAVVFLLVVSPWSEPPSTPGPDRPASTIGSTREGPVEVFTDDFSNPSSGWPRATDYHYDGNGHYHIRVNMDHNRLAVSPRQGDRTLQALSAPGVNIGIEVDAEVVSNTEGGMGLFCRMQPQSKDRYRAVVLTDGSWNISRDSKGTKALASGQTALPRDGGVYRVRLECGGPRDATTVTLLVGPKLVGQWTDADGLEGGEVGLQAVTASAPMVEVRFDNFRATRL